MLHSRSLTGQRLACASITSVAEVCNAPVTATIAMCCTDISLCATPTEPLALHPSMLLSTGSNQTSAAYVKLGMATAWYSWCICHGDMPVAGLASHHAHSIHFVALETILSTW